MYRYEGKFHPDRFIREYQVLNTYRIGTPKERNLVEKAVAQLNKMGANYKLKTTLDDYMPYELNGAPFPCCDMLLAFLTARLREKSWNRRT
jgi:hypothetical protein